MILLPENLFYNTTAAGVIVVLNKRKPAARKARSCWSTPASSSARAAPRTTCPRRTSRRLPLYLKGEPVEGELAVITARKRRKRTTT